MSIELELRDVARHYGSAVAVDGVSLEVAKGEVVALLGPSGCGNTPRCASSPISSSPAEFMNIAPAPCFADAAFRCAMSCCSGSSDFTAIGPTQQGLR